MFEYEYDVEVVEKADCRLIAEALKVYGVWLGTIKATCKNPIIDGIPAGDAIRKARELKRHYDGAELATLHIRR